MKPIFFSLLCLLLAFQACSYKGSQTKKPMAAVLVFYKTAGYYHTSIPAGLAAIQQLGQENGFAVDTTNNAYAFTPDNLKNYQAVIFLSTTQDVLNPPQENAFKDFINQGGGFVGIHAATDTEYNWPWYTQLVGAQFASHPKVQTATVQVLDKSHAASTFLPDRWERTDEWYNFKNIYPGLKVLAILDETTYKGGENGSFHPIAWYHEFDGGRAFYTAGGHTKESFQEPLFLRHLLGGIKYAMNQ